MTERCMCGDSECPTCGVEQGTLSDCTDQPNCHCTRCMVGRGNRVLMESADNRRKARERFTEEAGERAGQIARAESVIRAADLMFFDLLRVYGIPKDCFGNPDLHMIARLRDFRRFRARYRLRHERPVVPSSETVPGDGQQAAGRSESDDAVDSVKRFMYGEHYDDLKKAERPYPPGFDPKTGKYYRVVRATRPSYKFVKISDSIHPDVWECPDCKEQFPTEEECAEHLEAKHLEAPK